MQTPKKKIDFLSVIIPVYNSEKTVGPLAEQLLAILKPSFKKLELVLVNDGSTDNSFSEMLAAANRHPGLVRAISLSKNFGEHNAVMCGLNHARGECAAILDDDFQNPPAEVLHLVEKLEEGHDVVYSYYAEKQHSFFRNLGSWINDCFATWLLKKPKGFYLSSFKVLNRFLIDTVTAYQGPFPYLDGLILRSTAKIASCLCRHDEREIGKSNYTFRRLFRLWLNMFTGFSIVPLRMASLIGGTMSLLSLLMTSYFVMAHFTGPLFIKHPIPPGWASTIVCITFFGGLQLCVLGIIGEYLGRLFLTANESPQYVVRETYPADQP